jgi:hypothetical protein
MTSLADPTPAVAAGTVKIDPEGMARLGHDLHSQFRRYESDRRLAELKWERNARQFLGIYDPEIEKNIDKNRSQAYPKLTRVKCVSMLSRLMNLLFQAGDKNWTVAASPVPDLEQADLQQVLDKVMADQQKEEGAEGGMTGAPAVPSDEVIESAIREFAKKRATRMELEIEDQLQELGGTHLLDYVALCRKVLASGIQYGAGVLKGPFTREEQLRKWEVSAQGQLLAVPYTAYRPCFEFVSLWDYYPDMSAKHLGQMDGQYERVVMSRHQVIELKKRSDFFAAQIDAFLRNRPTGNYKRRAFETELRAMGVQLNTSETGETNKFEALVWTGHVAGSQLAACGVAVPDDKLTEDVRAIVWIMENYVVKAQIDPWSDLDTDGVVKMYHHFIFEEDESFLLGNGLPAIMRDSQLGVCAAVRMALDNGAVQRIFEVNDALLRIDSDITTINPDMVIHRDDDNPATAQYPAVRPIELPMNIDKMQGLARMFQEFADQETFVNAATGGDMQKGPSEPFRTATGASMLRGDAALPFKDVVRNFDIFTESVIAALLVFNRNFNPNPAIRGDFKPVARGATSLIAKEVLGMQLDNFATTLTPEEKKYINMRNLARARVRVRDLEVEDLVYDDEKCDEIDANTQAQQQQAQQQQHQMTEATIRQTLAAALKDLSQAGKNSAAAEATTANVILDALQKGLNPDQVSPNAMMGAQNGSEGGGGAVGAGGASAPGAGGGMGADSAPASAGAGPVGSASALAAAADPVGQFAAAMPASGSASGPSTGAAV